MQFHDNTSKYNLDLAYKREKNNFKVRKELKWRKSQSLEHLYSLNPHSGEFSLAQTQYKVGGNNELK